jgi:hypothetical protein
MDSFDPALHLILGICLQIEGSDWRDYPEGIGVLLERDGGTGMYFPEVQYLEKLILGRSLVIRQVSRTQNKPSLFPCLRRNVDQTSLHSIC